MFLHFHIHYRTIFGEQISITYHSKSDRKEKVVSCQTYDGENWIANIQIEANETIYYHYTLLREGVLKQKEWGKPRVLSTKGLSENVFLEDKWRPRDNENNAFLSTAFTESIFKRATTKKLSKVDGQKNKITFRLHCANLPSHLSFGICGDKAELGNWVTPVLLSDADYPMWQLDIAHDHKNIHIAYKYVIMDTKTKQIVYWEEGNNRVCHFVLPEEKGQQLIITDENFAFGDQKWRGSGVAIPVFSLRSQNGLGIGEFSDLKLLVDWTHDLGMNMIQVLPVNDTIANKTWLDSYPYAAISVFALHPLYINLQDIATLKDAADRKALQEAAKSLNSLEQVDFEKVLETKFLYLRKLYDQEYEAFIKDKEVAKFISQNESWLKSYAVFCHLRDKYQSCNFNLWPKYSKFSPVVTDELCIPSYEGYRDVLFYYFVQYHADKQLLEAKHYARSKRVVLKGDLPIGIYRFSCDAWVAPELYNMNEQAGAPPDDYAVLGQNWGFPTYNWSEMAKDGFLWWQNRMRQLNRYFDALRIDHILGFFRIWQIPTDQVEGTMGSFNPRLPFSREELAQYGITGDLSRFTLPHLTFDHLSHLFGAELEEVFSVFFTKLHDGRIVFKSSFDNQLEISNFVAQNQKYKKYEKNLLMLVSNVILLAEPNSNGQQFNPRITLNTTQSYSQLDPHTQSIILKLYNDYYYNRHDEYWRQQALWKLPAILDASDMLICGEDLGMIPKAVPGVMRDLNIISLEIQRMPKGNSKFGQVPSYPYFSVCSPSCHDMSTIRGWWQGDHENAKDYYYNYLRWYGYTPMDGSPEIVQAIVEDHLASPSMLAIFPIQDLVGMEATLRKEDAYSEQINEPSNPKHYWRFRFHLNMEDLLKENGLNDKIRSMVKKYGR